MGVKIRKTFCTFRLWKSGTKNSSRQNPDDCLRCVRGASDAAVPVQPGSVAGERFPVRLLAHVLQPAAAQAQPPTPPGERAAATGSARLARARSHPASRDIQALATPAAPETDSAEAASAAAGGAAAAARVRRILRVAGRRAAGAAHRPETHSQGALRRRAPLRTKT